MATSPQFRTQYTHTNAESDRTAVTFLDKSLTQQQFKDSSDINVLFGKYLETGEMPQIEGMQYGDFTGIYDFQTAMNAVRAAEESFQTLPARIKNRFDNNPQKLVEFINDPENLEEARFLKLVNPASEANAASEAVSPEGPAIEAGSTNRAESASQATAIAGDKGRGETARTKPGLTGAQ